MMRKSLFGLVMILAAGAAPAAPLGLSPAEAQLVRDALSHAADQGLDPRAYPAADVPSLLAYMRDLRSGRPALEALDRDVDLPPSDFDAEATLNGAARPGGLAGLLAGLEPPYPEYARLKAALAQYRAVTARGGWPAVNAGSDPALIRARLAYEYQVAADADLADMIRQFQAHNGLAADGKMGRATLAALNVPADARAGIIAANMERWRWLPRRMEPDRIVINVADARLELFLGGKSLLNSRVIVGRPHDPTPILRAEGAGITINPAWTIPQTIAAREILPHLKRDPAWLANNDMVLLGGPPGDPHGLHVNWRAVRAGTFPYRVRQNPGPKNPLGQVKIELPNRFDVYLHDTPGKAAFDGASRAVSHGCVRVEQILPLASYALSADLGAIQKIRDAVGSGATSYLPLPRKLPVYFLYWTAFAGAGNAMEFRSDIYGRDRRMIAALAAAGRPAREPANCARG